MKRRETKKKLQWSIAWLVSTVYLKWISLAVYLNILSASWGAHSNPNVQFVRIKVWTGITWTTRIKESTRAKHMRKKTAVKKWKITVSFPRSPRFLNNVDLTFKANWAHKRIYLIINSMYISPIRYPIQLAFFLFGSNPSMSWISELEIAIKKLDGR